MKRILMTLVLATAGLALAAAQNFTVGATETIKPFEEPIVKIIKAAGITPTIQYLPVNRLLQNLGNGTLQAGYLLSDEMMTGLKGVAKVPVVLNNNEIVAVTLKPDIKIASRNDLKNYKVGVERGNKNHKEAVGTTTVVEADSQENQWKMFAAGRFDVIITARALVASQAKGAGLSTWYVQEPALLKTPLYLVVSSSGAAQLDPLTAAFKKAVESGQWEKDLGAIFSKINK